MEKLKSCVSQEPFSKLEENGKASILNYNLPQSTCYDATSYLGLDLADNLFKANQKRQPNNDYWDYVTKLPREELTKKLDLNVSLLPGIPVIQTYEAVRSGVIQNTLATTQKAFAMKAAGTPISARLDAIENKEYLVDRIKEGFMPVYKQRFSRIPEIVYLPKPRKAEPQLNIVLHMKMCSFLGNYGAGRTLKTFSLLPGEKTTITMRTYQYQETIRNLAQNVLDSYSESSAEDLQTSIEHEVEHASSLSKSESYSKTGNWKAGGSAGLNLGFFKIGGGGGGGGSSASSTSINQAVSTQVGILVNSTSRHTSKSDSLREIEINSSTSSTAINETEETIVRELENINKSRVLNFVFRQLLQEFESITYLYDVSFVYSTGFPTQRKSCKLSGLNDMLKEILVNDKAVESVKNEIYTQLCSIVDYEGNPQNMIEKVNQKFRNCINPKADERDFEFVRVRKDLRQKYKNHTVNGIILDVTSRILRTPSVVVDALLGQGEALDCYNMTLQEAATEQAQLENNRLKQALDIIENIADPAEKAVLYKKVFGECCDIPQYVEKYVEGES